MTVSRSALSLMLGLALIGLVICGSTTATADSRVTDGNQPQLRQTAGPEGGFIISLLSDGPNLFAGTNGGGLYRSTDNGESWTAVNNGLTNQNISEFAKIGTNIYAGTRDGIFRSINQGESWVAVDAGLVNKNICSLAARAPIFLPGPKLVRPTVNGKRANAVSVSIR